MLYQGDEDLQALTVGIVIPLDAVSTGPSTVHHMVSLYGDITSETATTLLQWPAILKNINDKIEEQYR